MDRQLNLKDYKKLEQLASGGFATVYKVCQKDSKKIFVAKVSIHDNKKLNEKREINIFSQFEHPSILKFIGYSLVDFSNNPRTVIITEFCPNLSLEDIIYKKRGDSQLNWNDTKKLINIYGIAAGMSFLHRNEYIHRDLKPANIFEDEYLFPKIGDFGLSKHIDPTNSSINSLSSYKGTCFYTPPETWANQDYYTKAGDVYAFGIIVYEIITSKFPYKGCSFFAFMRQVASGERPSLLGIPEAYKDLISSCWSQNEHERPTFDEIVEVLKTKKEFITDGIDYNEFLEYIDYIDNEKKSFDPFKKLTNSMFSVPLSEQNINKELNTTKSKSFSKETDLKEINKKKEAIEVLKKCIKFRNKEATILEEQTYNNNNLGGIVLITSELGDFTTIGDMSKMIWELAKELVRIGLDVQVISPYYNKNINGEYDYLKKHKIEYQQNIDVFASKHYQIGVHTGIIDGVKCWFLHHPILFSQPYPSGSNSYKFDIMLTMASASLDLMFQLFEKMPRLIVTNDWLTGLIPTLARVKYSNRFSDSIFMHIIHCLEKGYQGKIYEQEGEQLPEKIVHEMAPFLPDDYIIDSWDKSIDPSRSALMSADQWGTISKTYRSNLLESSPYNYLLVNFPNPFACSTGINIENRKELIKGMGNQHDTKRYVQQQYFKLDDIDNNLCLFAFVGNFTAESGISMIADCFEEIISRHGEIQFIIGIRNCKVEASELQKLNLLHTKYPKQFISFSCSFNEELTIVHAADYLVVPSLYEPSGRIQQEAFVSGCPVIAFRTGGLKDTVFEFNKIDKTGNGILFWDHKNKDFMMAIDRACQLYHDKDNYYKMRENAYNSVLSVENTAIEWANEFTRMFIELFEKQIQ